MEGAVIDRILEAVRQPQVFKLDDEHQFVSMPANTQIRDLKDILPPPDRVRQRVNLLTVPSFLEYVNRFQAGPTSIFADEVSGRYEAVIDYHDPGKRGTLDHVATYECPQSQQWRSWVGGNGKWFSQVDFAAFLETNLREISAPPGAVFLQVALELQIHKSAEFESEVRLDNGQNRFRYQETIRGTTKAGDIEIPSAFTLTLPVFVDGAPQVLQARFRYRMNEGKLSLGYELIRHEEVWNAAVKVVTAEIRNGAPLVHVYAGVRR